MAEDQDDRAAREAKWWADWHAADYSWEGLAAKTILGGGQFGEATLQDYWRRDPKTGVRRSDATLRKTGELVRFDDRDWHLAHLPMGDRSGTVESWKANTGHADWTRLTDLIRNRLEVAVETPGGFDDLDDGTWGWRPETADGRARLDGAIIATVPALGEDDPIPLHLSFRRGRIAGEVDLSGSGLGPGTDFDSATFPGDAVFHSATFSGDADFDSAIFSGYAGFNGATFSGDAGFGCATFSGDAGFYSATFSGDADFDSAAFSGDAGFGCATFSGDAGFYSATFSGDADFDSAAFSGEARFGSATFSGEAGFNIVTFSGEADFNSATFSGDADFNRAAFSGEARFGSAAFSGNAHFGSATFSGEAGFNSAAFSGEARFDRATFSRYAGFNSATFKAKSIFRGSFARAATFQEAVFHGPVQFSAAIESPEQHFAGAFYAARFAAIANFSGAVGQEEGGRLAAAFGEAQFEKALILTDGLDSKAADGFHNRLIAGARSAADDRFTVNQRLAQLESGCRTIKIAMGKARDEVREQAYYRLQLRARHARSDIDGWEKAIGWLYGVSSDFGSSLSRPLGGCWPWFCSSASSTGASARCSPCRTRGAGTG